MAFSCRKWTYVPNFPISFALQAEKRVDKSEEEVLKYVDQKEIDDVDEIEKNEKSEAKDEEESEGSP